MVRCLPRDTFFINYMIVINQELCLINKRGVMRNGFTYVIDFSHRRVEHQWTGRRGCFELLN